MKSELIKELLKAVLDHEVRKHKKGSTEQTICLRTKEQNVYYFGIGKQK